MGQGNGTILIMTAVDAERDAVLRGLQDHAAADVRLAGVGPASAAAQTAAALAGLAASGQPCKLVISAGIGGGFPGVAGIGELVFADTIAAADLGAETPEGFRTVDELGFGSSRLTADSAWTSRLASAAASAGLIVRRGPILTVSTVTGTAETAAVLAGRYPRATAEAMEGYGVALAASLAGVPFVELRAVSNAVGPRNRAAWRIPEALGSLEAAFGAMKEVW